MFPHLFQAVIIIEFVSKIGRNDPVAWYLSCSHAPTLWCIWTHNWGAIFAFLPSLITNQIHICS